MTFASFFSFRNRETSFILQSGLARATSPGLFPCRAKKRFTSSIEIAKFNPSASAFLKLLTPSNVPESPRSGPPELPGLIGSLSLDYISLVFACSHQM